MPHAELQAAFLTHFAQPATVLVEAPGRVNLIGDHIDYNGLPVLPMAIRQRIRLLLRPRDDHRVHIVPLATGLEPSEFAVSDDIPRAPSGHWSNYARGGAQAASRAYGDQLVGFDGLLASDIPVAAGLSSSSALVVSVMLGLLQRSGDFSPGTATTSSRIELATLAARAERYVGTEGGGMDQAACLCGEAGCALRIDFNPLRVLPLAVPSSWRFVVAHSGLVAEKSGGQEAAYNERVQTTREALQRLAGGSDSPNASSYSALLSDRQASEVLSQAEGELTDVQWKRFRHTVTEASRVEAAIGALTDGNAPKFGALMTASHESLAKDYQVSTPELDALVEAAIAAGAFGARLTGAGFGGSAVALATESTASAVLEALEQASATASAASSAASRRVAFVAASSDGARVTRLS